MPINAPLLPTPTVSGRKQQLFVRNKLNETKDTSGFVCIPH
jgi:hypothetical protein